MDVNGSFQKKLLKHDASINGKNKANSQNADSSEKWVYFAIAGKWRKVGPGLFTK